MTFIIAGGRDFNNYKILKEVLDSFQKNPMDYYNYKTHEISIPNDFFEAAYMSSITEIVSGCANGADALGIIYAENNHIPLKKFPAQWDKYGKSAGFIRNAEMGDYADALIAFWDGRSPGTRHMIKTMKFNHKPCFVFDYGGHLIDKQTWYLNDEYRS